MGQVVNLKATLDSLTLHAEVSAVSHQEFSGIRCSLARNSAGKELFQGAVMRNKGELDQKDREILRELRLNARMTYAELGKIVGLSANPVKDRVERLVSVGHIRRFTIDVSEQGDDADPPIYAYVSVKLMEQSKNKEKEFERKVLSIEGVECMDSVGGDADFLIQISSSSMKDHDRKYNILQDIEGVVRISSLFRYKRIASNDTY